MTEAKPCEPGREHSFVRGHHIQYLCVWCGCVEPNAAPKASEAQKRAPDGGVCVKECRCDTCDGDGGHEQTDHNYRAGFHAPNCPKYKVERREDSPMSRAFTSALCAIRYLEGNGLKDYDDNHYKKNAVALARGCKVLGDVGKMRRTDRWE